MVPTTQKEAQTTHHYTGSIALKFMIRLSPYWTMQLISHQNTASALTRFKTVPLTPSPFFTTASIFNMSTPSGVSGRGKWKLLCISSISTPSVIKSKAAHIVVFHSRLEGMTSFA
jgi:hypothetical protein